MRAFAAGLCGGHGPVAAVSHGGVTTDLLRTLLGDEALPPLLLAEGVPPCAVTTLDDLRVVDIAATWHLGKHQRRSREPGFRSKIILVIV
jgi:broad specificity phosphatase PhoE